MVNALIIICAYLLGSIPSGLWIGKAFYKTDIREHGSGNLGATNTFRILGKKAGAIVTIIDILKGTAAVLLPLIPYFQDTSVHPLLLGAIAVFGHMYPIFAVGNLLIADFSIVSNAPANVLVLRVSLKPDVIVPSVITFHASFAPPSRIT